jgi:hypothetical protein
MVYLLLQRLPPIDLVPLKSSTGVAFARRKKTPAGFLQPGSGVPDVVVAGGT